MIDEEMQAIAAEVKGPVRIEDLWEAIEWLKVNEGDAKCDQGVSERESCLRVVLMLQRDLKRRERQLAARAHDDTGILAPILVEVYQRYDRRCRVPVVELRKLSGMSLKRIVSLLRRTPGIINGRLVHDGLKVLLSNTSTGAQAIDIIPISEA